MRDQHGDHRHSSQHVGSDQAVVPELRSPEPPLALPYYGAPPMAAVRRFFGNYLRFRGRASR
ncbi:hypothetical protein C5C14_13700, partial [Rathayibacter rathayi]